MQQTLVKKDVIYIVGKKVRTNNESEMNPDTWKISPLVQEYVQGALFDKIQNRKTPGKTFCVYTEYESDHTGDYTFYIGEEVTDNSKVAEGFHLLEIPKQSYEVFTTNPGPMPDVVRNAWFDIWKMDELTSRREFKADFEVYDERAQDLGNAVLDIYIGVK